MLPPPFKKSLPRQGQPCSAANQRSWADAASSPAVYLGGEGWYSAFSLQEPQPCLWRWRGEQATEADSGDTMLLSVPWHQQPKPVLLQQVRLLSFSLSLSLSQLSSSQHNLRTLAPNPRH